MRAILRGQVSARWELVAVVLTMWVLLMAIPTVLGQIGISWDMLNHHVYLGWTAENPRFGHDYLAAGFQSYQYPYLYWPVYKLAVSGASGVLAGVVLATLHATAVPALWLIARSCIPGAGWPEVAFRFMAVVLGFGSGVVLAQFDSTSNDLLAGIPLLWSVALALLAMERAGHWGHMLLLTSGALAGISVACKLSNGPIALLGPLLWVFSGNGLRERLLLVVECCIAAVIGFLLAYGYWGWQLWVNVGNPVYPFGDAYFEPLRQWLGWRQ